MSKKAILLVDDDKQLLDSLTQQLRSAMGNGVFIETAQTLDEGREAITSLEEDGYKIMIVIADWLFGPNERSNDFLEEVSRHNPQIPLVMLSGYADDAAVERARQLANLKAFFAKPWVEDELMAEVKRIAGL